MFIAKERTLIDSIHNTPLQHGIRAHGGMDRRVLAVLLYEDVGGAEYVQV